MKSFTILVAASVLAVTGRVCIADANADAKKAIQSGMNKAMQYIVKQDFDSLVKLCTPDCTFTDSGQTMGITQMVDMMKAEMANCKDAKMSSKLLTCTVSGDTATCTSHDTSYELVQTRDKKWHKLTTDGISTNIFVKSGGAWIMKSLSGKTKMFMDGKSYDPAAGTNGDQKKQ